MTRTASRLSGALALGACLFLAACGGEDGGTPPPAASRAPAGPGSAPPAAAPAPAGPSKDQLKIVMAIQQYQAAVDKGDGKAACALMSKDLQFVYSQDSGAGNCVTAIRNLHESLGEVRLANTRVNAKDVEVKGSMAVLSRDAIAKTNGWKPKQAESFDMIKTGGRWLIDYIS